MMILQTLTKMIANPEVSIQPRITQTANRTIVRAKMMKRQVTVAQTHRSIN